MKKSRIWIITGIILLFGAFGLTIHNYYEDYQAKNNAADAVQKLAHVMKRENTGLLYKMNPDIEMPTKTINGIKYRGAGSTQIITAAAGNVTLESRWLKDCTRTIQRKCL